MKRAYGRYLAVLVLLGLGAPQFSAAQPAVSEQTKKNLEAAMQGEAYEYVLYRLYAKWAELSGYPEVARAFEQVADSEGNDHFAREAAAYGLVRSNRDNLQAAMKSEADEQIRMNVKYAEEAAKAGDTKVAAMFREIAGDEKEHYSVLKKALDGLKAESAGNMNPPGK